jgi:hypothetical protein
VGKKSGYGKRGRRSNKKGSKKGYDLGIRKQLKNGMIRSKPNGHQICLKDVYLKIKEIDSKATWYLHHSQRIF